MHVLSIESHHASYRTYAVGMSNARYKRSLGSRIRSTRTGLGISQRQLALMTGTSRSYLWKIETGTADIGIDILIKVAQALDVQVRDLIDF